MERQASQCTRDIKPRDTRNRRPEPEHAAADSQNVKQCVKFAPPCINRRLSGKRGQLPAPWVQPVSPRIDKNVRATRGSRQDSRTFWKAGALAPFGRIPNATQL